jgi:hypothetical protein
MVNNSVGKIKEVAGCVWVRARLPLWVGDHQVQTDGTGESGDLSSLEHQMIERHLDRCAACCRYRSELKRALAGLTAAAADLPVEPQASSLWPALKRRIQDLDQPAPSRCRRVARACTERWARGLSGFAADQGVRLARARDRLQANFTSPENGRLGSNQRVPLALRLGLIASLLIAVIAARGLWHEWSRAQSTIKTNTSPLANRSTLPVERASELEPDPAGSDDSQPQAELVQADIALPVEPPGGGMNGSTEAKLAAPARFDYDLEHGIPMPPDARESKPVY